MLWSLQSPYKQTVFIIDRLSMHSLVGRSQVSNIFEPMNRECTGVSWWMQLLLVSKHHGWYGLSLTKTICFVPMSTPLRPGLIREGSADQIRRLFWAQCSVEPSICMIFSTLVSSKACHKHRWASVWQLNRMDDGRLVLKTN